MVRVFDPCYVLIFEKKNGVFLTSKGEVGNRE